MASKPARPAVTVRPMALADVPRIQELERVCFPSIPADRHWKPEMIQAHVQRFPDGQWVAARDGLVVGSAMNLRVRLEDAIRQHSWREITGGGYLTTHSDEGDALYGTEIMVHPDVRRQGIAKRLYQARKDFVVENGLKAFVSGGRIPGYETVAGRMSPHEYVARVIAGVAEDRVLTPQLKAGMRVAGILQGYLTDARSHNYATILLWMPAWAPPRVLGALDEAGHDP